MRQFSGCTLHGPPARLPCALWRRVTGRCDVWRLSCHWLEIPIVAHIAQSVEHILGKDEVTGSIPVVCLRLSHEYRAARPIGLAVRIFGLPTVLYNSACRRLPGQLARQVIATSPAPPPRQPTPVSPSPATPNLAPQVAPTFELSPLTRQPPHTLPAPLALPFHCPSPRPPQPA